MNIRRLHVKAQLKYLTFCLCSLSFAGCSQHVIKTNPNQVATVEQRAIHGLNAMFETSSYDFRGKLSVQSSPDIGRQKAQQQVNPAIAFEPALKKRLDQYLKAQNIRLNSTEKQNLYAAMAKQQQGHADSFTSEDKLSSFNIFALNLLNNTQFEYDGSVHYREKTAALNLAARYEKPTLLVQMKVPMVVDFKEYKFYTNYFSLMPYLVNKDSQNSFAYIDFSKYKADFERVNVAKLADYLKAVNALPYILADARQIKSLPLSVAEKNGQLTEKIRFSSTLEELMLQMALFEQVNEPYLKRSVLGYTAATKVSDAGSEKQAGEAVTQAVEDTASLVQAGKADAVAQDGTAYSATLALRELVSDKLYGSADSLVDEEDVALETETDDESPTEQDTADETITLTVDDCQRIIATPKTAQVGDLTYCVSAYELDAFKRVEPVQITASVEAKDRSVHEKLALVFAPYVSEQFIDAAHFAELWATHQPEIRQVLAASSPAKKTPIQIDVGLDAQGRAAQVDYAVQFLTEKYGKIDVQADMRVFNYGQASKIDRAALRDAKSIQEVSKGSILEKWVKDVGRTLEQPAAVIEGTKAEAPALSYEDELNLLADKTYQQAQSFSQTYQTLFLLDMAAEQSEWVKNLSPQTLQEMAEVYAYWFSDEQYYDPKGKELERIKALQKKHHLEDDSQFNRAIGSHVNTLTERAVGEGKVAAAWHQAAKQYKQPQHIFAQQYLKAYREEYPDNAADSRVLKETAQILGQSYIDSKHGKLSQKTIQDLTLQHAEVINYEIYMEVYENMQKYVK